MLPDYGVNEAPYLEHYFHAAELFERAANLIAKNPPSFFEGERVTWFNLPGTLYFHAARNYQKANSECQSIPNFQAAGRWYERHCQAALRIPNHALAAEYYFDLGRVDNYLATYAEDAASQARAMASFQSAAKIYHSLADLYPEDPDYLFALVECLEKIDEIRHGQATPKTERAYKRVAKHFLHAAREKNLTTKPLIRLSFYLFAADAFKRSGSSPANLTNAYRNALDLLHQLTFNPPASLKWDEITEVQTNINLFLTQAKCERKLNYPVEIIRGTTLQAKKCLEKVRSLMDSSEQSTLLWLKKRQLPLHAIQGPFAKEFHFQVDEIIIPKESLAVKFLLYDEWEKWNEDFCLLWKYMGEFDEWRKATQATITHFYEFVGFLDREILPASSTKEAVISKNASLHENMARLIKKGIEMKKLSKT